MLGWFVGRTLRRNALRDVETAQNVMAPEARLAVARRVFAQMALVERQRDAANGAIDLQKAVLRQATADKRAVGRRKVRPRIRPGWRHPWLKGGSVRGWLRRSARFPCVHMKGSTR